MAVAPSSRGQEGERGAQYFFVVTGAYFIKVRIGMLHHRGCARRGALRPPDAASRVAMCGLLLSILTYNRLELSTKTTQRDIL